MEIKDPKPNVEPLSDEDLELIDDKSEYRVEHTLESFLNNPSGSGTKFLFNRKMIIEGMTSAYHNILKKHKKFDYRVYKIDKSVVFHIKIPSETVDSFTYDVCIEFLDVDFMKSNIISSNIRFFSNAPSFIFTYAYTFDNLDLLINYLKDRFDRKVFDLFPKQTNPENVVGYEKTITFALMYIKDFRLTLRDNYSKLINTANKLNFRKLFLTQEQKFLQYNHLKKIQSQNKKQSKQLEREHGYSSNTVSTSDILAHATKAKRTSIKTVDMYTGKVKYRKPNKVNTLIDVKVNNITNRKVNTKVNNKVKK